MISNEYIAGIFDGEGCICVSEQNGGAPRIEITITNTNLEMLTTIRDELGYGAIRRVTGGPLTRKQCYGFRIEHHLDALNFLERLQKHLIVKREKCEGALGIIRAYPYRNSLRDVDREVIKRYHRHLSLRSIAGIFGVSKSLVWDKLHE